METEALIVDVASGYCSGATMDVLRAGQLQKRLISLASVHRVLVSRHSADLARSEFQVAYDQLKAAQQHSVELVDSALMYPTTGAWLARMLQRTAGDGGGSIPLWVDLGYLGWLALSVALRYESSARSLPVVARNDVIFIPGRGQVRLPGTAPHGICTATWSDQVLLIERDGRRVQVDLSEREAGYWTPCRRLQAAHGNSLEVESLEVELDDLDPFRPFSAWNGSPVVDPLVARVGVDAASDWQQCFDGAWQFISENFTGYAAPMQHSLQAIVPLSERPLRAGVSETDLSAFGTLSTTAPAGPYQLALTLIHEMQHAKLGALIDLVQLHADESDNRFYAPWRDDPRPLAGLIQGVYAHIAVTEFWRSRRSQQDSEDGLAEIEFAHWRAQVQRAVEVVAKSGILTSHGRLFVHGIQSAIASWESEGVSAEAEVIAQESATAHRVGWHIRNLAPDNEMLHGLAQRWVAGELPGRLPQSRIVSSGTPEGRFRSVPSPRYLRLQASRTRSAAAAPSIELLPPEQLYLAGRFAEAEDQLLASLRSDPLCPRIWAGLALTLRCRYADSDLAILLRRADVVAHLMITLGQMGEQADVVELCRWLSRSTCATERGMKHLP